MSPNALEPPRLARPELLAPAGDWDCARAAVENGADAIYFGLDKFNARMRAKNFTEADLPKLMEFLHLRGVRGYVTVNTLVFQDELADAERYLRTVIAAGADAVIVQDVGICRLIRSISPDFPIHASTQMTISSVAGVEFARELGCELVVLARECSLKEIETIHRSMSEPRIPLEVFVHGALCVAYSGQCLTSEALGGRSANRGECAQACRMPYDLISDGEQVSLGDRRYLLSPQDLSGIGLLPELAQAGVASLKIEGRLKAPEYVANITRVYRQALDRLVASDENASESAGPLPIPAQDRYEMEMAFSRGLHTGWLEGIDNQELVHARFGKKRGVYLGRVVRVLPGAVRITLETPLKPGDGVVFDAGRPEEEEEGGRVYEVRLVGAKDAEVAFGRGHLDLGRIQPGDRVWKTSDPDLEKKWRQSFGGDVPRFTRPLDFEVHGQIGTPLTVIARDEAGHIATAESSMPLVQAEHRPLGTERLRDQLGRLGGTPFHMGGLDNQLEGEAMLPVSELNRMRRELADEIAQQRATAKRWTMVAPGEAAASHSRGAEQGATSVESASSHAARMSRVPASSMRFRDDAPSEPQLIVLVRSLEQMSEALEEGIRTVYCDFENPKHYRDAVGIFRRTFAERSVAGRPDTEGRGAERPGADGASAERPGPGMSATDLPSPEIWVAPPRIFKTGEEWTLRQVRSCDADGYLVRNYDHFRYFSNDRKVGDYSLNVANQLSAELFLDRGLERVTASYDLDFQQMESLLRAAPPTWFEVTIHQHMPMFHMEHCVYCAFLSDGKDYRDCGRPCDVHDVRLRDRVGAQHPLKADAGCRNTVFNSQAQTGAEYVERMLDLGVRHFRIEFLNESPKEVAKTIRRYQQLLRGEISGSELWREMKLLGQLGVTRGQMAGRRS